MLLILSPGSEAGAKGNIGFANLLRSRMTIPQSSFSRKRESIISSMDSLLRFAQSRMTKKNGEAALSSFVYSCVAAFSRLISKRPNNAVRESEAFRGVAGFRRVNAVVEILDAVVQFK